MNELELAEFVDHHASVFMSHSHVEVKQLTVLVPDGRMTDRERGLAAAELSRRVGMPTRVLHVSAFSTGGAG